MAGNYNLIVRETVCDREAKTILLTIRIELPPEIKFSDGYEGVTVAEQFTKQLSDLNNWEGEPLNNVSLRVDPLPFHVQHVNLVMKFSDEMGQLKCQNPKILV